MRPCTAGGSVAVSAGSGHLGAGAVTRRGAGPDAGRSVVARPRWIILPAVWSGASLAIALAFGQSAPGTLHAGHLRVEGSVALEDILRLAGVPLGQALRGQELTKYVVIEAADGYRVVFALAELDPAFRDHLVLLADRQDGQSVPEKDGPLRLIVPDRPAGCGRWSG